MHNIPVEILDLILLWLVRICRTHKNAIKPARLVCKDFNSILRPYFFKCLQLEFTRFVRKDAAKMNVDALERIGQMTDSLYLDLMVIRDEEEISRLTDVFQSLIPKVPEMPPLLESLQDYCMNERSFDENDYRNLTEVVLNRTPNLARLKLNLPFQVVGQKSRTATLLLATTMKSLVNRPEEFKCLEYLVIDHVSDTTIIEVCNNPLDVSNTMKVFKGLKHIILSIKRQESRVHRQNLFAANLWHLIEQAKNLESLCIVGWNIKRNIDSRVYAHGVQPHIWNMRALPFSRQGLADKLMALRFLELKRVDIDPQALVSLVSQVSKTLKELYLNEVYLKVRSALGNTSLWVGYPGLPRPADCCWVADDLHNLETLNLDILRATGIGYDDLESQAINPAPPAVTYDLRDPSGRNRSFDKRFVQAVMNGPDPIIQETMNNLSAESPIWPPIVSSSMTTPATHSRSSSSSSSEEPVIRNPNATRVVYRDPQLGDLHQNLNPQQIRARKREYERQLSEWMSYDAETYQRYHNTTSWYKRTIDDYFYNHNEKALTELQRIINVADRGMNLLQSEIDRTRNENRIISPVTASMLAVPNPQPPNTIAGAQSALLAAPAASADQASIPPTNSTSPDPGPVTYASVAAHASSEPDA